MAIKRNSTWTVERLENVCAQITDGKHGDCQDEADSGYYFLSCKDVSNGRLNYGGARQITEADFFDTHRRTKFGPSDILITNSGTIGRMAIAPNSERTHKTTFQKSVAILKPITGRIEPRFLYFALHSDIQRLIGFAGGTAQKNLLLRDLRAFEIRIPPLPAQQRIVGILSAYDELMENCERRIRILEAMARTLYREWFVEFRFPGHEKVGRVASPLGEIPQGWEVKFLPECVHVNPRVFVPRDGEKPFVPMGCLSNDSMLITDIGAREGNSGAKFQNGDTLFARITPCLENGKTGFVQFLENAEAVAFGSTEFIVLRSRSVTPEYVYCLARSEEFRGVAIKSMSGATGRQRVQEKCFDDCRIAQPPSALLDRFSATVGASFRLIYKLNLQVENLRRTHDLLLPRLLAGEIPLDASTEVSDPPLLPSTVSSTNAPNGESAPCLAEESAPSQRARRSRANEDEAPSELADEPLVPIDQTDRTEVLHAIRQVFSEGPPRPRADAIREVARALGYRRTGTRIQEVLSTDLRTAVRRGILENTGDGLRLGARSITDYDRDFLKEQFLGAVGRAWMERDDAVRSLGRWLGFARTGQNMEDTARSLINGLIREGRLETDGQNSIRRI